MSGAECSGVGIVLATPETIAPIFQMKALMPLHKLAAGGTAAVHHDMLQLVQLM